MKIKGYKFQCDHVFYVYFKNHYCPICKNKLSRKKVSEIINSESSEARSYVFEVGDVTVKGNMKFTHIEFYCSQCDKYYSVKTAKENKF